MASVFVLSGPTSTGKSDLAVELAREFHACVVSADAMTVYRGMDVGTAKPSKDILKEIRHYGVDVRDLHQEFSVADFCRSFDDACREYDRVIVAGGTPFYVSALFRPLANLPSANPEIRKLLEGRTDLHATLSRVDPRTAARIHPNDRVRVIRALEVLIIQENTRGCRFGCLQNTRKHKGFELWSV